MPGFWPGESHGQRSLLGYCPGVAQNRTRLSNLAACTQALPIYCALYLWFNTAAGLMGGAGCSAHWWAPL